MNGGIRLDTRKCKRIVEGMVDILQRDDSILIALTGMKGAGGYLAAHSTNVAVLAMAMGRRLGAARGLLAKVGLAALLHDVGRSESGELGSDSDHTRAAAHRLLDTFGFSDGGLRCVLAALGHHRSHAITDDDLPPMSHSLIAAADFFDTATHPTGSPSKARATADVLERMSRPQNGHFTEDVVALLADVVGQVPRGSIVELDSGETGVVCGISASAPETRLPLVRVVPSDTAGADPAPSTWIDLAERAEDGTQFKRTVRSVREPSSAYETLDQLVAAV
jgi:hypothetical protein